MNKKFTIIIVVTTVLLVALLIVLGILRSKPQTDSTSDQFASPTNIPNNQRGGGSSRSSSSGSGSGNNNSISGNGTAGNSGRGNGISATPRQVATPTPLPKVKLDALSTIQRFLPYNSDALAVDYSAITNKIYVQKKGEKADEEFQQFLTQNNLVDIYNKSPELFLTSQSILAPIITNEEQKIEFSPEEVKEAVLEPLTSPTSIPNPNDPSKQMLPMVNVFKTLMGLNTILLPPSEIIQSPSTQSTTSPVVPVNINYGKDTTNIPCAAGTDYGPADGYTNGVLTRIRTCRVAGMVVNSQVSKQVSDMHAAWTAAGIPLSGGSFRTMAGQISIYQNWCKIDGIVGSPPPYPKPPGQTIRCPGGGAPGYSNHQMGMAIDFNCAGTLIPRKYAAASQNRCFQWLSTNAGKYGFFEYGYGKTRDGSSGYEGWHWSVNGN
ncbi:MAG: M15 family metallopeptidase [Microgenomates group bacterium]|nr:MAG: D-alanyl-D-alanine carboxypeptidase family protein [Candidatus Roizmanbacteria bacterium]